MIVVGTDGLFKYASADRIAAAVRGCSPPEAAERLVSVVKLASGAYQDDVGVVVISPAQQPSEDREPQGSS